MEDVKRKEKAEETKYSDGSVEINRTKQSNYKENKTEKYHVEKEQQAIKSENCLTCHKLVETGCSVNIAKGGSISNVKEQQK